MNERPDIVALAAAHGQSNLRFFVPLQPLRGFAIPGAGFSLSYTSSQDEYVLQECVVDDEGRYPDVSQDYKVSLKPLDSRYESRDYYVSDLESIIHRDKEGARVAVLGTDIH